MAIGQISVPARATALVVDSKAKLNPETYNCDWLDDTFFLLSADIKLSKSGFRTQDLHITFKM